MKYRIKIVSKAEKALIKIELSFAKKIRDRIDLLSIDPRHPGSIKLSGYDKTYRTRVGKYRIIYEVYDSEVLVLVINIDHRKDVYR